MPHVTGAKGVGRPVWPTIGEQVVPKTSHCSHWSVIAGRSWRGVESICHGSASESVPAAASPRSSAAIGSRGRWYAAAPADAWRSGLRGRQYRRRATRGDLDGDRLADVRCGPAYRSRRWLSAYRERTAVAPLVRLSHWSVTVGPPVHVPWAEPSAAALPGQLPRYVGAARRRFAGRGVGHGPR